MSDDPTSEPGTAGRFCRYCGAELAGAGAAFCGACGKPVAPSAAAIPMRSASSRRRTSPLAVALWVAGLVLAAFFIVVIVGSVSLLVDDGPGDDGARSGGFGELVLVPGREQPVEAKEATIGASGGAIRLDDGASVTVPAGAVSAPTLLRVERILPGLEDFDFTVGSSAIYRVTLDEQGARKVEPPLILEIPWEPDRTLVVSLEDGQWVSPRLASTDAVRVELDHFSTRTILAIGASFASGLRQVGEQVAGALPRWDLRAAIQDKEAAHRKRIEAKAASTRDFFGIGETTKRQHAEICEEFKTVLLANTTVLTFTAPAGAPGTTALTNHLGDAGKPSAGSSAAKWYWDITSASHAAIRAKVVAAGLGHPISPAAVLRIAIDANGGNVPLGVLAAHNVLKDVAYEGRALADPTEEFTGGVLEVAQADGQFVASIETWRRGSDHSPSGRYDKMGPLYHIFAAMAARVWGGELYAQAAISAEALLRGVGWGPDIPDPEKGAADECGRDIGDWLADFVAFGFEPVTDPVQVGKEVPLTLTVRNLPEQGLSIALKVISGEGSLSRNAINVSRGSSGGACDVIGTTAVCGLTFMPEKGGEAVVEARSGKTTATVKVGVPAREYQNLVVDGGFESGGIGPPWGTGIYEPRPAGPFWGSADADASVVSNGAHGGQFALRVDNRSKVAAHVYRTLSQKVNVEGGAQYCLTFWARTANPGTGGGLLTFRLNDSWDSVIGLGTGTANYRQYAFSFAAEDGNIDVRMVFENEGTIWVDDIVLSAGSCAVPNGVVAAGVEPRK